MKKRQRKKNKSLERAIRLVSKKFIRMSDSKFHKMLDKYNQEHEGPTCQPGTCGGECQSMGWCENARRFREEEIPRIMMKGDKDI